MEGSRRTEERGTFALLTSAGESRPDPSAVKVTCILPGKLRDLRIRQSCVRSRDLDRSAVAFSSGKCAVASGLSAASVNHLRRSREIFSCSEPRLVPNRVRGAGVRGNAH